MRWLTIGVAMLALAGCDSVPPAPDVNPAPVESREPELPAAEPAAPSLKQFRAAAAEACATAQEQIATAPLRGDPLHRDAGRRDVTAAVRHFATAANAWTAAANTLFDFGLPVDPLAQSFIGALDTLALRDQQAADALAAGEAAAAQGAVAVAHEARRATDGLGRELGIGPLQDCGAGGSSQPHSRTVVVATDFGFRLTPPDPGRTRVILRNEGEEEHQLFVVKLREPGTLAAALDADRAGNDPGAFLAKRGRVSATIPPGGRTSIDLRFRPGAYAFLCFVASPDGTPHAYKGMAAEVLIEG